MKLSAIFEDNMPKPTQEMVDFFEKRTKEHIDRVSANLADLYEHTDLGPELLERAKTHDASKYSQEERVPYIWNTEYYRCKNNGEDFQFPPGIEEQVREASYKHITSNRHHPEFHDSPRDMTDIDIAEMVADWTAMSQELGEGSPRGWAEKNIGNKWDFSSYQIGLIYDLISLLENTK